MNVSDDKDKQLNSLFQKYAAQPNASMAEQVMVQISKNNQLYEYKPIIGKTGWICIVAGFCAAMMYMVLGSEGVAFQAPELVDILSQGLSKVGNSFNFDGLKISWPSIPSSILVALMGFISIGVYLIISYSWWRRSPN